MISRTLMVLVVAMLTGCGSNEDQAKSQPQKPPAMTASSSETTKLVNQKYIDEGLQQLQDSDIAGAIKSFDEAIKANPTDLQGYLVLGQTYMRLKEYSRAIDTFNAASRISPEDGEIYYLLAVSYGLSGKNEMARESAQKSVTIFQNQQNEEKFVRSVALLKGLTDVQ